MRVLLLHGPNLSQLGTRDPSMYGTSTLDDLVALASEAAAGLGATIEHLQSDGDATIIRRLHDARTDGTNAVIINPGAWTHYNYAIRDAIEMLDVPTIELHLSNIHAREEFRHRSVIAAVCTGSIIGLGSDGYPLAVQAAVALHQRVSA